MDKARHLVSRIEDVGGALAKTCLDALVKALGEVDEAETKLERELNAIEAQLQVPEVMCVICREIIRPCDNSVRLPCMCVFHEQCIMPSLRNGTITCCPLNRVQVPRGIVEAFPVWAWHQQ